jgi:hypothetical protein
VAVGAATVVLSEELVQVGHRVPTDDAPEITQLLLTLSARERV